MRRRVRDQRRRKGGRIHLRALSLLKFKQNRLATLPENIGLLTVSQTVLLGILPESIGQLTAFAKWMFNFPCYHVPENIGLLTALQTVLLGILPESIGQLTALQS